MNVSNKELDFVFEKSKLIEKNYPLCDYCLGRMFAKKLGLTSSKLLGKKLHKLRTKKSKCYICKDLLENLEFTYAKISNAVQEHDFSSFLIGAILKPSIIDRDDSIRSKFKLRGIDSVKADITKELSKKLSRKTKAIVEHKKPELTITVDFKKETINLRAKPLFLSGRYTKYSRGFPQKQKSCVDCEGKGCSRCNFHGMCDFDSVEGQISLFLYKKFGAKQVKISWIGGEDKTSLVLGNGRPFFVQIINPIKRKIQLPNQISLNEIKLHDLKIIDTLPKEPLKFKSLIEISIETENPLTVESLKKIKEIKKSSIAVYDKAKRNEKFVYSISYKKTGTNSFIVSMEVDGGLPVKKFVGSDIVFPNLSDLLGNKCRCKEFDFHQVLIQ